MLPAASGARSKGRLLAGRRQPSTTVSSWRPQLKQKAPSGGGSEEARDKIFRSAIEVRRGQEGASLRFLLAMMFRMMVRAARAPAARELPRRTGARRRKLRPVGRSKQGGAGTTGRSPLLGQLQKNISHSARQKTMEKNDLRRFREDSVCSWCSPGSSRAW